jgi:hypothetical protein
VTYPFVLALFIRQFFLKLIAFRSSFMGGMSAVSNDVSDSKTVENEP